KPAYHAQRVNSSEVTGYILNLDRASPVRLEELRRPAGKGSPHEHGGLVRSSAGAPGFALEEKPEFVEKTCGGNGLLREHQLMGALRRIDSLIGKAKAAHSPVALRLICGIVSRSERVHFVEARVQAAEQAGPTLENRHIL